MMHVLGACIFFSELPPHTHTDSLCFSIISVFYFCLQSFTLGILINYKFRNAWNKNWKGTCLFDTRTKLVTQKKIKISLAPASQDFLQLYSMLFSSAFSHYFQVPDLVVMLFGDRLRCHVQIPPQILVPAPAPYTSQVTKKLWSASPRFFLWELDVISCLIENMAISARAFKFVKKQLMALTERFQMKSWKPPAPV